MNADSISWTAVSVRALSKRGLARPVRIMATRALRAGAMGVLFLALLSSQAAMGHMNSVMNLELNNKDNANQGMNFAQEEDPNAKWQCKPETAEERADGLNNEGLNNYHLRGVNLGSWMVLEPWITPSMFFQFLGKEVKAGGSGGNEVAMDMHSFCVALGPEEGNKQLRRHWRTWVTEMDIAQLATLGINTIRLPVGDWMYKPYGPYVGCTDGSLDEVDRLFVLCRRYGIRVVLDIHAVAGSQNGFDNSGKCHDVKWTTYSGNAITSSATFVHWPYRAARWIGEWNAEKGEYTSKNETAIANTLEVIQIMVNMYANETAVVGLQPVNEPWQFTPVDWLKDFYWAGYHIVREQAEHWLYLMHDSFNFDVNVWGTFMKNCPTIALDTHIYQAWATPGPQATYLATACDMVHAIEAMEKHGMPVVVGEWSLATDNCAMWLNGFQDNLPGYPQVQCKMVSCPLPYMGSEQPGAPPNPNSPPTGPFGTGSSTPSFGKCPIDATWHPEAYEDEFMTSLAHAKIHAFETGHGWFFWNFKTELEVRWNYMAATQRGYFPYHADTLEKNQDIIQACDRFNGRIPVKGMPPGIYAEKSGGSPVGTCSRWGNFHCQIVMIVVAVAVFVVGVAKFTKDRRNARSGGWQAVQNGQSINGQGQLSAAPLGYQEEYVQS